MPPSRSRKDSAPSASTMQSSQAPHDTLLSWATSRGLALTGVAAQTLHGRGTGLVATRPLSAGETVLSTPTSLLRTLDTVSSEIRGILPRDMTVHGLLAADLAVEIAQLAKAGVSDDPDDQGRAPWTAMMPKPEEFSTVPLNWPESLQELLPLKAKELLKKQKAKFEADWTAVSTAGSMTSPPDGTSKSEGKTALPSSEVVSTALAAITKSEYQHAWLLVNTRTFYFVTPSTAARSRDDHMALQPVADLFNHTDRPGQKHHLPSPSASSEDAKEDASIDDKRGCHVSYDEDGFTITTTRSYETGEELHICYGQHGNDFLLVEYGFVLEPNVWDEVQLDEVIMPMLRYAWGEQAELGTRLGDVSNHAKPRKRRRLDEGLQNGNIKDSKCRTKLDALGKTRKSETLEEKGFLGNYMLDGETVCYRTEIALRAFYMEEKAWRRFVDEGIEEDDSQSNVTKRSYDDVLRSTLEDFAKLARERAIKAEKLGRAMHDVADAQEVLVRRWKQISKLISAALRRI